MIVGSNVFFKNIAGFKSKDIDILELVDKPTNFTYCRQFKFPNKCVFQWPRLTPQEFIDITLNRNVPMELGKFLVPEFIQEIGFTIEDLKQLQSLVDALDDKHKYEEVIYNYYLNNNDFYLTKDQLNAAYEIYLKYRQ